MALLKLTLGSVAQNLDCTAQFVDADQVRLLPQRCAPYRVAMHPHARVRLPSSSAMAEGAGPDAPSPSCSAASPESARSGSRLLAQQLAQRRAPRQARIGIPSARFARTGVIEVGPLRISPALVIAGRCAPWAESSGCMLSSCAMEFQASVLGV